MTSLKFQKDMPWNFKPLQYEVEINIGESGLAFYEAFNPTDRPVAGQATFNVVPFSAGQYFTKIDPSSFEVISNIFCNTKNVRGDAL